MTLDEIDDKIAEGIGRDAYERRVNGFMPSMDWNDAMHAAERCREFVKHFVIFPRAWNGTGSIQWVVSRINQANELGDDFVSSDSGPMAVCLAILKLKDSTDETLT